MGKTVRYRLGLDLGANSLGWCIVQLNEANEPIGLIRMGVRLFRDGRNPKDKASLAVARRMARGMRRRRDRWLKRQRRFMQELIRHGLMPADDAARKALTGLDPYALRQRALDQALMPHEVGRALFHVNQRRGFKSNRKLDKADEKESGKIKSALKEVRERLQADGARTIGEWLALLHAQRQPVRARLRGQGAKAAYELYVGRGMIEQEFDAIWAAQSALQPGLFTAEAGAQLREILLRQRPLKPVKPGRCTLEPMNDKLGRAPLALPSSQRFRILQELNNLRYDTALGEGTALTLGQRDEFAAHLEGRKVKGKSVLTTGKLTFDKMRQLLKLPKETRFNLESEKRDGLKGNAASAALAKATHFGDAWHEMSLAQQDAVVEELLAEESESAAIVWLLANTALTPEAAEKVANSSLPDGHINLGRIALAKVLPALQRDVVTYDKAVQLAGYAHHSQLHSGEVFKALPYYGIPLERHVSFGTGEPQHSDEKRYGRIANPTVHIGLNQVRKLVNAVIARYGTPTQIALEVTRELKQSLEQREEIQKKQAENQKQRDLDRADLSTWGQRATGENLLRMKLWHELRKAGGGIAHCPYSGRIISQDKLFSEEVEIEHILPFSKTLDDSIPNKTLSYREANRQKKNGTPFEAFGQSLHGYDWEQIQARAAALHNNKRWRSAANAMEQFEAKHGSDFLARHLNDTAYLSRIAKAYLGYVCHPNDVWVTPGRLTALLRGKWGLNQLLSDSGKKDRTDHRHHAVDAAAIAVTDRGLLKRMSDLSAQERLEKLKDRILVPHPWDGFREAIEAALPRIVVSYKPDHGYQAGLHNDTAYGFAEAYEAGRASQVVHRVPLPSLTKLADLDEIREPVLRERIKAHVGSAEGKEFAAKLAEFSQSSGVSRVRIVEKWQVMPFHRKEGKARPNEDTIQPYKGYLGSSNYCMEICRDETGKWIPNIVTSFDAAKIVLKNPARLRDLKTAQNGFSLVMRISQDDVIAIGESIETRKLYRVCKLSQNGQVFVAALFEANVAARSGKDKELDFTSYMASTLFKAKARRVFVTELGFVLDPGFKP